MLVLSYILVIESENQRYQDIVIFKYRRILRFNSLAIDITKIDAGNSILVPSDKTTCPVLINRIL